MTVQLQIAMADPDLRHIDACRGCVLGAFIGDALGAPVELLSSEAIRADPLFATGGVTSMRSQLELASWLEQADALGMTLEELGEANPTRPAGHYTDDTLMLLSLCDALVSGAGRVDAQSCVEALLVAWRTNEEGPLKGMRGFGSGTQKAICALDAGTCSVETSGRLDHEEGSNRNGGAMRIAPVGLLFARVLQEMEATVADLRRVVTVAIQATHVHPEGIDGAVAVSYVVAMNAVLNTPTAETTLGALAADVCCTTILRGMFDQLKACWVPRKDHEAFSWDDNEHQIDLAALKSAGISMSMPGFTAVDGAAISVWMFLRHGSFPNDALVRTIALGGDTDTLCCMVGALVGARHGWQGGSTFPADWVAALENGVRGKDYAVCVAEQLACLNPILGEI